MTTIKLPRLPVNWREQPQLFETYWDQAMSSIETALNAILSLPEIQTALADLNTATQAAQNAADNANAAADATASETSLVNSFPKDPLGDLIGVDDAGAVIIADHTRQYGDTTLNPDVPVDGDTFASAGVAGDLVRVYYLDPARVGGTVTYLFTLNDLTDPVQGGDTHVVGSATVPGAGTQTGNGVRAPGYVDP